MSSRAPTEWDAYAKELGLNLRELRKAAGLTQENLAHTAGLTRTHYQQIELGSWKQGAPSNPSVKVMARIAQVLEVPIGDLFPPVSALKWSDAPSAGPPD